MEHRRDYPDQLAAAGDRGSDGEREHAVAAFITQEMGLTGYFAEGVRLDLSDFSFRGYYGCVKGTPRSMQKALIGEVVEAANMTRLALVLCPCHRVEATT